MTEEQLSLGIKPPVAKSRLAQRASVLGRVPSYQGPAVPASAERYGTRGTFTHADGDVEIVSESAYGPHESAQAWKHNLQGTVPTIDLPEHAVKKVLEQGYKTQHTVGDSRGGYNPYIRGEYEHRSMGYPHPPGFDHDYDAIGERIGKYGTDPANHDEDEHEAVKWMAGPHPVYGHMAVRGSDRERAGYGEVSLVLKPSVLRHTTVTFGDSLASRMPVPYHDAATGKANPAAMPEAYGDRLVPHPLGRLPHDAPTGYIEAQYHKPITRDDIDHIVTNDPHVQAHAERHGIPWQGRHTDSRIPDYQHSLFVDQPGMQMSSLALGRSLGESASYRRRSTGFRSAYPQFNGPYTPPEGVS